LIDLVIRLYSGQDSDDDPWISDCVSGLRDPIR